jgi:hypothetical protein
MFMYVGFLGQKYEYFYLSLGALRGVDAQHVANGIRWSNGKLLFAVTNEKSNQE